MLCPLPFPARMPSIVKIATNASERARNVTHGTWRDISTIIISSYPVISLVFISWTLLSMVFKAFAIRDRLVMNCYCIVDISRYLQVCKLILTQGFSFNTLTLLLLFFFTEEIISGTLTPAMRVLSHSYASRGFSASLTIYFHQLIVSFSEC